MAVDNRERTFWNVVKGIAMYLMLWGHSIQYCAMDAVDFFADPVFKTIYTFHMPVLMLVSGYLFFYSFVKRDWKTLMIHKIQSLLQPMVFASILANLLLLVPKYFLTGQINFLNGELLRGVEYNFWFLWAVLLSSLVVGTACKITEQLPLQLVLSVVGSLFMLLFSQWNMTLFVYPFFVVGFFCAKYREKAAKLLHSVKYLLLVAFPVLVFFFEKKHYIYLTPVYSPELGLAGSMSINAYRCFVGLAGSACLMLAADLLLRFTADRGKSPFLLRAFSWLGENSLAVYCISVPLMAGYLPHLYQKVMEPFGYNVFADSTLFYDFVLTTVVTVGAALVIWGIVWFLRKVKLHKLIFGR